MRERDDMNEQDIERAAAELGSDVRIDVERVARRVVAELRTKAVPALWWRKASVLRAAAAIAILVTGGVLVDRIAENSADDAAVSLLPVGLEELSTTGLNEVLDSLDLFTPASELTPASLNDFDEVQLRELLVAMEG
ncbi:MAG: hypothetical protein IIA55_10210 [Gemmatimonadetes bacterium]|nr:hypothetical protein [Gemmatimonadota bacterium]